MFESSLLCDLSYNQVIKKKLAYFPPYPNAALGIKCNWTALDNLLGSDHFPIKTEIELKYQFKTIHISPNGNKIKSILAPV